MKIMNNKSMDFAHMDLALVFSLLGCIAPTSLR